MQEGSSLQGAQGLSSKGEQTGRELAPHTSCSHTWADFLHCDTRGGQEHDSQPDQTLTGGNPAELLSSCVTFVW